MQYGRAFALSFLPWKSNIYSTTYYEFVSVALLIQYATRMRRIVLSSAACRTLLYFSTLYYKRHHFPKQTLLNIGFVFWFSPQILSTKFLILRRIQRDIITNLQNLHVQYPLFLPHLNQPWILSTDFRKTHKYKISRKSIQWEPKCSMGTDGEMDRQTRRS
jgi:hypothetical protein